MGKAMRVPQSGYGSMMKEGTKSFSGVEEAVYRNINAIKEFAGLLKTSFGPNGMNKLIVNQHGRLFLTNDASTMVKELEIQHPAAKIILFAADQLESEIGDGSNSLILFSSELLSQAATILKMGLRPSEVIQGYSKACDKAIEVLETLVCSRLERFDSKDEVVRHVSATISSKQFGLDVLITDLVATACLNALPRRLGGEVDKLGFNVDNVRVCKIIGGGLSNSSVINGLVFKRDAEGAVKHATNAKVAVYACGLDIARTETKGTVLIKNAADLLDFSNLEESNLDTVFRDIAATGVKVLVTGSVVGDMALHFCDKYKLMVVKIISKFDLRRLCQSLGAIAMARLGPPTSEEIGHCATVNVIEIGEDLVTVFDQSTNNTNNTNNISLDGSFSPISTIVIRGATSNMLDDVERAIANGVNIYKRSLLDNRFVAGAAATEIALANAVIKHGETCPGLDQYAVKCFGKAFEGIARILADNAGIDSTELISNLYAAHASTHSPTTGINIKSSNTYSAAKEDTTLDAAAANIFDLYLTKLWMIKLATNAVNTILSVDQIIMARPAGGPKPRADNKHWDDD